MADRLKSNRSRTTSSTTRHRASGTRKPSQGQKTTSKSSESRAAARKVRGASHAKIVTPQPAKTSRRTSTSVGSGSRAARSRFAHGRTASIPNKKSTASSASNVVDLVKDKALENKAVAIIIAVIAAILLFTLADTAINWDRAYGNVSINGMSVAGMTSDEMRKSLEENFASKLPASKVSVYASEEARQQESSKHAQEESVATAEEISVEESQAKTTSWTTDGSTLAATLPYDDVISQALEAGRKGGPFGRIALALTGEDVPLSVTFDAHALDTFAADIDKTLGDARVDATVEIKDGKAQAVAGHDGIMVDRDWLAERISDVFLEKNGATYVIAEATDSPSRTTMEQAESMSDAINRAIAPGATFSYKSTNWTADATELGKWTKVEIVESNGGYDLHPSIDSDIAVASLIKNLSSSSTGPAQNENVIVDFEQSDNGIVVKTSGSGEIPEVVPGIEQLNESLYGNTGAAWASSPSLQPVSISIAESNAPESMMFDQAVDLGIVTVIGEYKTEFSNEEGTENRNHNIKLVADILNDTICESNGGEWSFNTHTGDTNLDPPFASAGSIVNGEYVDSIGGGICQVATTVFNAVFEAGLDVVQRKNHSLFIGSYPTGRDVGVSYPELDFVWANKLPSDVLLKLSYTDTSITAKLYGVYTGYKVEATEGQWEEGSKYRTEFETDDSLAKGDYYLKTVGEDGSKISVTRTVTDKNGAVVSETVFDSVYEPKNEVYLVGPGTDTSALVRDTTQSSAPVDTGESYTGYDETAGYADAGVAEEPVYYDEAGNEAGLV